jgi:hypothetical protein
MLWIRTGEAFAAGGFIPLVPSATAVPQTISLLKRIRAYFLSRPIGVSIYQLGKSLFIINL